MEYHTVYKKNVAVHGVPVRKEGDDWVYSFKVRLMIEQYVRLFGNELKEVNFQEIVEWFEGMDMKAILELSKQDYHIQ